MNRIGAQCEHPYRSIELNTAGADVDLIKRNQCPTAKRTCVYTQQLEISNGSITFANRVGMGSPFDVLAMGQIASYIRTFRVDS